MTTTPATLAPSLDAIPVLDHEAGSAASEASRRGDISARLAGFGAFTFVGIVILQNVLRGSSAPANGASAQTVATHYADHRSVMFVLAGTFVVSGIALATFLGGTVRRLLAGPRPGWAITGLVGGVGILSTFTVLLACEQALSVLSVSDTPDLSAIDAVWTLHNCVFTLLWLAIAVGLLGLSRAGVAAGVTPRAFARLGPIGAVLLGTAAAAGPAIANGDAQPLFGLALVGFVLWLAFLVATGLRLIRTQG